MYIEMLDETQEVSQEMMGKIRDMLNFAAKKLGKENKEMAITFVDNEKIHQINLEYRDCLLYTSLSGLA
ncbi:rRNA maturation RNAse YbeY, partial [Streptococcus sobrinus]|uniref:rRNA maturation RNAse YbeY n=1 Tax=Streptococcus sobrinus TaxID=1310 RepID=UPI000515FB4A